MYYYVPYWKNYFFDYYLKKTGFNYGKNNFVTIGGSYLINNNYYNIILEAFTHFNMKIHKICECSSS